MPFKPMLAGAVDLAKLRYPLLASAKLDGVRAMIIRGRVMSRSLKEIPNGFVQARFRYSELEGLDGELIVGDPRSKTCYRDTVSGVMRIEGTPAVDLYVFDYIGAPTNTYKLRLERNIIGKKLPQHVHVLPQHYVMNESALLKLEEKLLSEGYEGLILRDPAGHYKYGRSTANEGWLLKLKRFVDAEFEVIGFEERMHNGNEATTNELGRTARSSHQAGKSGRGDLGALILQGDGFTFNVGTGFDDSDRAAIWNNRDDFIGKFAKVKYFAIGMKDAPRHPVFLGWRDKKDM